MIQPKLLILITSCHGHKEHQSLIRKTWLRQFPQTQTYYFVVGKGDNSVNGDVLEVKSGDAYSDCPLKMFRSLQWAMQNEEFDYIFYCDDDTYVVADRLIDHPFENYDYYGAGPTWPDIPEYKNDRYVQGGAGIFLSKKAVETILSYPEDGDHIVKSPWSDMMVGRILKAAGIPPVYASDEYFSWRGETLPHKKFNKIISTHAIWHPDGMMYAALEMNPFLIFDRIFWLNPSHSEKLQNQWVEAGIDHLIEEFDGTVKDVIDLCKDESFLILDNNTEFRDGIIDLMVRPAKRIFQDWTVFCVENAYGFHPKAHKLLKDYDNSDLGKWLEDNDVPISYVFKSDHPKSNRPKYPIKVALIIQNLYRGGGESEILQMIKYANPERIVYSGIAIGDPYKLDIPDWKNFPPVYAHKKGERATLTKSFEESVEKAIVGADLILKWHVNSECVERLPHPSIMLSNTFNDWVRECYKDMTADYYIGNSNHSCKVFPAHAPKSKISTIYSGRDTTKIKPDVGGEKQREIWGVKPDEKLAIFTGRLILDKNLATIIKAVSMLDNWKLVLKGQFNKFDQIDIENLCEKYIPYNHILVNWDNNLGDCLAASDAFVIVSDYEGFSNSLGEAWLAGTPTVFSRCGSVMELQELYGPMGVEVPVNVRPPQLAKALELANRNAAYIETARKVMLRYEFNLEYAAERWQETFDKLYLETLNRKTPLDRPWVYETWYRGMISNVLKYEKLKTAANKLNLANVPPPTGFKEWTYVNLAEVANNLAIGYKH